MINAVEINDSGNYTCYVRNVAATKSISVMLTVAGAISRLVCIHRRCPHQYSGWSKQISRYRIISQSR